MMSRQTDARLAKILLAIPLVAIAAFSVFVLLIWVDHFRQTTLPSPTGPFALGRARYLWKAPRHLDPPAPKPGASRELIAGV
jgi:hypothetical protein